MDEKYMWRALQIALCGKGYVSPNPMVGAIIVHQGRIVGEGYHRQYGQSHAEINALESVADKSIISQSTMYVSLEPCSHYGKTPPCALRLVQEGIKRIFIATLDPNPLVTGRGVKILQEAGIEVAIGVLEKEAQELNKEFFTYQQQNRPYVYLKWAQTKDNFIDKQRTPLHPATPTPISSPIQKQMVHKIRSETMAIMVGTNTAINDNPMLTNRLWSGKSPLRVTIDRHMRIPKHSHLLSDSHPTLVYSSSDKLSGEEQQGNTLYIPVNPHIQMLEFILTDLRERKINSLLVEGGSQLLQSFINAGLWDEAFVEIANKYFTRGVPAPNIRATWSSVQNKDSSIILHYKNSQKD